MDHLLTELYQSYDPNFDIHYRILFIFDDSKVIRVYPSEIDSNFSDLLNLFSEGNLVSFLLILTN